MRSRLPVLLAALLLGFACAYATACGEDDSGLITSGRAEGLKANLDDLEDAVTKGQCQRAAAEIENIREQVERLPRRTEPGLRRRLEEGVENLAQISPTECEDSRTTATTDTTPTETVPTETTPTETVPTTPTETTPTTPTETTPTTPPETTPTAPPETTPTTPPQTPPGGEEAPGVDG